MKITSNWESISNISDPSSSCSSSFVPSERLSDISQPAMSCISRFSYMPSERLSEISEGDISDTASVYTLSQVGKKRKLTNYEKSELLKYVRESMKSSNDDKVNWIEVQNKWSKTHQNETWTKSELRKGFKPVKNFICKK